MSEPLNLLIITNLYPLPWEPNRATFNRQQFHYLHQQLGSEATMRVLIPVAWPDWLTHRQQIKHHNRSQTKARIIPYFYLPKIGRRFYSLTMFASLLLAWRWIKQAPLNHILVSWAYPEGVAVAYLAKWLGVPYTIKAHGSDINMHCQSIARRKQVVHAANNANGVMCVSQALKTKLVEYGVAAKQIEVIYNGVDQTQFQPAPEKPLSQRQQLIFVGNLKPDKGVFELLEAFALLSKPYPELTLHYYGAGTTMAALTNRIAELGLQDRVVLHGSVAHAQLPSLFHHARLLVLPSYHEGVPNVLLEAMASGVPCVATAVGGIPEIVSDETGVLVEHVADVPALHDALQQALTHSWQQQTIRASAVRFDWQLNAQTLHQLIAGAPK